MADHDKGKHADAPHRGDGPHPNADASPVCIDEVLGLLKNPQHGDRAAQSQPGAALRNIGQIERISLPAGWHEGRQIDDASCFYREFLPGGDSEARLCIYSQHRPMAEGTGRAFHDLLKEPAHELMPAELWSIGQIIRDQANPDDFTLRSAHTKDVRGKRVLEVEGTYKEIQEDVRTMYVDAGDVIQEIYFQAPSAVFLNPKYQSPVKAAFASLRWK